MMGVRLVQLVALLSLSVAWVVRGAAVCSGGQMHVAESIPVGLDLEPVDMYTYEAWMQLISQAQNTIDIAAFYVTLTDGSSMNPQLEGWQGQNVYDALKAAAQRGVHVRLVQNTPTPQFPDNDSVALAQAGLLELRNINWTLVDNGGILHTKLMIADSNTMYMGSANMDWRALSQVKEMGLFVEGCPLLCADANRIFGTYWLAAENNVLPNPWPQTVAALYNDSVPLHLPLDNVDSEVYLAASPPNFVPHNRTGDLEALLSAINGATESVSIEVMDYFPTTLYMETNHYWPYIDDAIRAAAFRGVRVRFLAGIWNNTLPTMFQYLQSLDTLGNVTVRAFLVPDQPAVPPVPFTRVNHAKYLVTEAMCYIGTSNWTGDYYITTGGGSFNWKSHALTKLVQSAFDRDWNSVYAHDLSSAIRLVRHK